MRIAVVGARGQLGAAVVEACAPAHEVAPLTRAELDITDDAAVARVLGALAPDAIVNCAAYNAVDAAEDHPVDALNGNAFAVRALARAAEAAGALFVHYGTDFVFDGTASRPYTEDDRPNPKSAYGASKMLGEWFALDWVAAGQPNVAAARSGPPREPDVAAARSGSAREPDVVAALSGPQAYVLRVESLFGSAPGGPARGSVAGIYKTLLAGGTPKVFSDRTITPTYVVDAAAATLKILETRPPAGIYHCVSTGQCTWLEFATELARLAGFEPRFEPVRMVDVPMRAQRPLYCALSNRKLASVGIDMPAWQDALARYVRAILHA